MSKLCQINRVKNSFDSNTLPLIISASVMSKLFYCSTVWSNTANSNVKKLQCVQNLACIIITGTSKFDHITLALQELNWLPIKQHLLYRDSIMTFKCMKGLAPSYLSQGRSQVSKQDEASLERRRCEPLGGSGGMPPRNF